MAEKVLFVGPLERVLFFRTLAALDGLSATQLAAIAQNARERFFPRGSLLLHPGRPPEAFYLVAEGKVVVNRFGRRGEEVGPGEAVGFLHLLARAESGVEARALTDTLALELDWDAQVDVSQEHFPVLLKFIRYISHRLVRTREDLPDGGWLPDPPAQPAEPGRPLDLVQRILALSHTGAFSTRSYDALAELARHLVEVRYRPGESMWEVGDDAETFLLLVRGAAQCRVPGHEVRSYIGPFQFVGMDEALARLPRWFGVSAEGEVTALRVALEPLLDIFEDHFEMALDFLSGRALRLIALLERERPSASP